MRLGDLEITAVSDGSFLARPSYFGTDVAPDAHPEMFSRNGTATLPIGCFLIRGSRDGRVLLVDAGLGPQSKPMPDGMHLAGGRLLTGLAAAGLTPADITDVVCTHLHSDHVGWLFDDRAAAVFPGAALWFGAGDWDHFVIGPGEMAQHIRGGFLANSSRLRPIDADTPIAPGIRGVPAPGHTPGHLCVVVKSGENSAWLVGDAITCPVQLTEPTWHSFGDTTPNLAELTRQRLWDQLGRPSTVGTGAHFPHLRFGRVRGDAERRQWMI